MELDSPVVPSTGLIFEGEIGADGGENSHPFAALYRAELGSMTTLPFAVTLSVQTTSIYSASASIRQVL